MLGVAFQFSLMSKDPSTQVGALLVSPDRRRVCGGYNGFPSAIPDGADWWETRRRVSGDDDFTKYDLVNHAEQNAMSQAKCDLDGWTLYCTHRPCLDCARRIVTEGVSRVVYAYETTSRRGMDLCVSKVNRLFSIAGVRLERIEPILATFSAYPCPTTSKTRNALRSPENAPSVDPEIYRPVREHDEPFWTE